jgi:hypothetical protein
LNDRDSLSPWGRDFIFATAQAFYRNDAAITDSGSGGRGRRQLISMNCSSQESWKRRRWTCGLWGRSAAAWLLGS